MNKLYTSFTLIVGLLLLLSSCDSFLDIQPTGKVIPNSLAEYRALLTTAYQQPFNDRSLCEMRTEIVTVKNDEYDQNNFADIEKWNDVSPTSATMEFGWEKYYTAIYYTNAIIDKKNNIIEGSQEEINQLVGEAYLLRGYLHFILVNLYGQPYTLDGALDTKAIPLKLNVDLEEIPSRNTVKQVYASILSDIQTARELINQKEWELKYSYRFSTLSVDAMESRVRLYMGEWQEAYDAAENVLSQKSTLEDLNNEDSKAFNHYESVEMLTAYENIYTNTTSKASLAPASFLQKIDKDNDKRWNIYFGEINQDGTCPIKKVDGSSQYRCSFRVGEVFLNSAEAAAQLNKLPEARTRLLQLMKKRYSADYYAQKENIINSMNQEGLITEILNERTIELAFEGHHWFDLRRTTRPQIEKILDGKNYLLEQNDARYTLRIPKSAISANPGLLN